jgi:hypothetical protein
MKRLVFTEARGKPMFAEMALGLGRSLKLIGDTTPRAVLTDLFDYPWDKSFDMVIPAKGPRSVVGPIQGLEYTDADAIIGIDADSLVFKRLDPIFDYCEGMGFAVEGFYKSEGNWHGGDIQDVCRKYGVDRIPKFNGGFNYYERTPKTLQLVETMRRLESDYASLGFEGFKEGRPSQEVCILLSMLETRHGELIPDHMDFMNTGVGLIGNLTLDVMSNDCHFVCRRHNVRFVRPYIFHAHFHSKFLKYWKQLDKLAWLERYEAEHGHGYMSFGHKLRRSIERRLLKLKGKL